MITLKLLIQRNFSIQDLDKACHLLELSATIAGILLRKAQSGAFTIGVWCDIHLINLKIFNVELPQQIGMVYKKDQRNNYKKNIYYEYSYLKYVEIPWFGVIMYMTTSPTVLR